MSAGDVAATTKARGDALESAIVHAFCAIDGISFLHRDEVNAAGSEEIDILLFNERVRSGLPFLPDYLVFECKNWAAPVDSASVQTFITKLRNRRLETGILVAANGITGDPTQRTAAHDIIRASFDRDGVKLLVICRGELESLRSAQAAVLLFREKFGNIILGKPVL